MKEAREGNNPNASLRPRDTGSSVVRGGGTDAPTHELTIPEIFDLQLQGRNPTIPVINPGSEVDTILTRRDLIAHKLVRSLRWHLPQSKLREQTQKETKKSLQLLGEPQP